MASSSWPPLGTLSAPWFPSLFLDPAVSGDTSTEPPAVWGPNGSLPHHECCLMGRAVAYRISEAPQASSLARGKENGLQATL